MALSLPVILPFDLTTDAENLNAAWTKWCLKFDNYLVASGIKDTARRKALFLHCVGDSVHDTFCALRGSDTTADYEEAKALLTQHFAPKQNIDYEIFKFREAKQFEHENIDAYHVRLRTLSKFCAFADPEVEIKRHIIQICLSKKLRRTALQDPSLTLDKLLQLSRLMELSEAQATSIEKTNHQPNSSTSLSYLTKPPAKTRCQPTTPPSSSTRFPRKEQPVSYQSKCGLCGGSYPHPVNRPCPAKGKTCNSCGRLNHFTRVCRSPSSRSGQAKNVTSHSRHPHANQGKSVVRVIQTPDEGDGDTDFGDGDTDFLFSLKTQDDCPASNKPLIKVRIGEGIVTVLMDSGSDVNVISNSTYQSLPNKPKLQPYHREVFAYGANIPLDIIGAFNATISVKSHHTLATFYVTDDKGPVTPSLIGYPTLLQLNILPSPENLYQMVNQLSDEDLTKQYPALFSGIGKMKDVKIKLAIDKSVTPVAQPHRRIPFHLRQALDEELDLLLDQDIIEPVSGPTPWVSPVVLVMKGNKLRLCVDMRIPNTAIVRERHIMPTLEDIIHKLNGATVFSKLDLNKGYHQLELDEGSRPITTFSTHRGLYRYKRLSFGVNSAAEIFHHIVYCMLQDISGTVNASDDVLVFGTNQQEHDIALKNVLQRFQDNGITLNLAKCLIRQPSLEFYGHVFGPSGLSINQKKIKTLQTLNRPSTPDEVRSLLGLATYCSRFIPNFSDITLPLRALTKKDTAWKWGYEHDQALATLNKHLSNDTILSYFDPAKETVVYVDASATGLGAILSQLDAHGNISIISFASKALTDVESRYSQTEREALAVVWSCEHFHLYLYGSPFRVITDHLPLLTLLGNPKAKTSARIERWNLRLAPYALSLVFKPGKLNPADYLSRHPREPSNDLTGLSPATERHVHMVLRQAIPKALTYEDIVQASNSDQVVQRIIKCYLSDNWRTDPGDSDQATIKAFSQIKHELDIVDGVILKAHRIYVPPSLQDRVIAIAHEGHMGLVKTKQLLRTKVWFPKMDERVEHIIKSCIPCLAATPHSTTEPLRMTPLPTKPWSELAVDNLGPFKNGTYLLVIIDEHSRFPLAEIVSTTSVEANVKVLDRVFSIFGVPDVVKSDNGPPFNAREFTTYLKDMGVHHRKITPLWPQANGTAERFMASLAKALRTAEVAGTDWKEALTKFLRNYRLTPHCTTGKPPSTVLFGRTVKGKLPTLSHEEPKDLVDLATKDHSAKTQMKNYQDKRRQAKPQSIQLGDTVLVKAQRSHKLSPYFNPLPYTVTNVQGPTITAERHGHTITRNSSFYKPYNPVEQNETPAISRDGEPSNVSPFNDNTYNSVQTSTLQSTIASRETKTVDRRTLV